MARPRHKQSPLGGLHRLALAGALVVGAAGVGSATPEQDSEPVAQQQSTSQVAGPQDRSERTAPRVSRSAARTVLKSASPRVGSTKAGRNVPNDLERLFVTTDLNVRAEPSESTEVLTVLSPGTKVKATGRSTGDWAEVLRGDKVRWVHAAYLSDEKPQPEQDEQQSGDGSSEGGSSNRGSDDGGSSDGGGHSSAPCDSGSSVESGLSSQAVEVYRAVCAKFPEVDSYGGSRSDSGAHGDGRALDVMVSDSGLGDRIADWARANAGSLGISEVIWSQQIWTTQRSSEGWRSMEDRGSPTANHMDHVHITVG